MEARGGGLERAKALLQGKVTELADERERKAGTLLQQKEFLTELTERTSST